MDKINRLLIPYDFGDAAKRALDYAFAFSGDNPETQLIIGFILTGESAQDPETNFAAIKKGIPKPFRGEVSWCTITPSDVSGLLTAVEQQTPDLLIMGTGGSQDPDGTTHTSQTVLGVRCPVLVVPQGCSEEFSLKKMALILGPKEIETPSVLKTLLSIARTFNAKIQVLTIENSSGTYGYTPEEERNESKLEYYLEDFYANHVFIKNTDVVEGVFEFAEEKELDLLAIIPRNHLTPNQETGGQLTRILTLRSHTPLLTIPC